MSGLRLVLCNMTIGIAHRLWGELALRSADLAHPGGNITGCVNFEHSIGGKRLELLKDTCVSLSKNGEICSLG
jgi:hypothetical protein